MKGVRAFKNMSMSNRLFYVVSTIFWIAILFITVYPLYLVLISSVSDPNAIALGQVTWRPVNVDLVGYKVIMGNDELWGSYLNSIIYVTAHVFLSIFVTMTAAYAKDIIKIITPLGYEGTAKYYIKEFGLDYTVADLIKEMHKDLYPIYRDRIVLKPYVAEYLHALKKEGHSLNVLTASPYRMVAPVLKREMVYDLFDNVWSCEDFGMTKGQPEIYLAAVERVGGKIEDTVFFDDNVEAVRIAVKAGLFTVGVYDDASADYIEELKEISNKYIYNFSEMRFIP